MNISTLIKNAIAEDMPEGDITTDSLGKTNSPGRAKLMAKQDLVLSGQDFFTQTVLELDPNAHVHWLYNDGDHILKKQCICTIEGNLIQILKAERFALNFLGRFSGIATAAKSFQDQVKHTATKILDTRKTFPNHRRFEKQAVVDGGAFNHRMNLSDKILIKENHIRIAGSLKDAVEKAKNEFPEHEIEVEVTNFDEIKAAVEFGAHRLLLDNMNNETLKEALTLIPEHVATEASGNMTLDRVKSVAETGVDFISVGALTHSSPCADMSLLFDWDL